jgi:hypothetical protein
MRRLLRRTIALTAAYALALQAILALSAAASLMRSPGITICRANDAQPGAPVRTSCDACLTGHCAGVAGKGEVAVFAAPWLARAGHVHAPRLVLQEPSPRRIAAHAPRAPPRA